MPTENNKTRKVILFIAQSLDGYIAKLDGNIDFLDNPDRDESIDHEYDDLMANVDTVVMGRTTYDQVVNELMPDHYPYEQQQSYILTSHLELDSSNRHFRTEPVVDLVEQLRTKPGKGIWIIGGSSLIAPLVNANLIDEYVIAVLPTILGGGIPLFNEQTKERKLELQSAQKINDIAYLKYVKKFAQ